MKSLLLALIAAASLAHAQDAPYPSRAVKIVVPFAPGGATDITARLIGERLSTKWGQPVVVENHPGAGGNVGSDIVAKAKPDGYTLLVGVTGSHAINASLMRSMPYHPLRDFEPLTLATIFPNAIVVNAKVPANTLAELTTASSASQPARPTTMARGGTTPSSGSTASARRTRFRHPSTRSRASPISR